MHAASRNVLRVEMAILAETAILAEMAAPEETMLKEVTRKRATIAKSRAISYAIVFTTNMRRKHEKECATAPLQSPPLEIEISCDYPVMLSPPLDPPIQLGSLIPWPLTICATIAALSSHSKNYADLCSLNLAMITRYE